MKIYTFIRTRKIIKGEFFMCGIVGFTGKNKAVPYLIDGLHRLEYRGYDSAGVAVIENDRIETVKSAGRLKNLEEKLAERSELVSCCGIGHTRWATHGEPNDENAHPHQSEKGLFCIVHNGIIENFFEIKEQLQAQGVHFFSETDTEVISQLLEKNYNGDVLCAIRETTAALEGSFALAILFRDEPDKVYVTRRSSPLVLGKSEDGTFIASDVTAMLKYTKDIYKLEDDEIAVAEKDKIIFYDRYGNVTCPICEHITWSLEDAEKGGFDCFMLKEITEQPRAVDETVKPRIKDGRVTFENISFTKEELLNIDKIYIVACGSAYHVGVVGKYIIEKMTRISCEADIASEFRYRDPILDEKKLVIIISQSGETADTLAALRLAKEHSARTLSIVNVVGSTIANESDDVIYTHAGPEIAVATTKAYSAQLAVIYLITAYFAQTLERLTGKESDDFVSEILQLPKKIQQTLDYSQRDVQNLSKLFEHCEHAYFIGRNLDYAGAMEASLKLKEISYIHSEAYGAGELKHGTISLIEPGTVVVALCCNESIFKKTLSNIKEVRARGACVIAVTTQEHRKDISDAHDIIVIPNCAPELAPSLEVIPMQLLSYHAAKRRGCDVDKPRNLAKSVTVE